MLHHGHALLGGSIVDALMEEGGAEGAEAADL